MVQQAKQLVTNPHRREHTDKLCTAGALRAHCGRTEGTCIKDHPEEMEGGNIKQHMQMQQHNRTICSQIFEIPIENACRHTIGNKVRGMG